MERVPFFRQQSKSIASWLSSRFTTGIQERRWKLETALRKFCGEGIRLDLQDECRPQRLRDGLAGVVANPGYGYSIGLDPLANEISLHGRALSSHPPRLRYTNLVQKIGQATCASAEEVKCKRGPSLRPLEFLLPHLTARLPPRSSGTRRPFRNARLLFGLAFVGLQMFAAAAHAADYHRFTYNGHTIDYALILPDHFDKSKAYPVLLALPPGDQSRQMVEAGLSFYWEAEAKRRGWVVISPSAPSGENFYSGLERQLPPLLDEVAHTVLFEGGRVHLAGISNGGLSAYRVITEFPDRFLSLTVLPGVPPDARAFAALKSLKGIPIAAFVGGDDTEWVRSSREASQELDRLGIQNTLTIVPGSGHVIPLDPGKLFDLLDQRRLHTATH